MGAVCTVQNYIDHDPGPGWRDHSCGPLSYDGHRGIDIRVPTQIEMRRGVAVIAAADGEVPVARDGQPRSEEHTSELQSLMRRSYAVFCLKKKRRSILNM